ncbi:MAG: DMT family transporter [Candidatus Rokuibacteriota bacterium]
MELSVTAGALCALGSAVTWALIGLVARALSPYFNALVVNMLRSALGGGLLVAYVLVTGGLGSLLDVGPEAWLYVTLSVIAGFALGDTMFFESARLIGLAPAFTVSMIYPLIASAAAVWLFGERVTLSLATGAVIALGGVTLIVTERAPASPAATGGSRDGRRGLALALLAACAWALSTLLMKPAVRDVDPVTIQAARLPMAALALWLTPWARGTGRRLQTHLRDAGPLLLALGTLTGVSAVLFIAGLKYAGVALTTVLSSTAPLFALPIGYFALGERVSWRAAGGAALCVAGLSLLSL